MARRMWKIEKEIGCLSRGTNKIGMGKSCMAPAMTCIARADRYLILGTVVQA
jgi:hypothetical protein